MQVRCDAQCRGRGPNAQSPATGSFSRSNHINTPIDRPTKMYVYVCMCVPTYLELPRVEARREAPLLAPLILLGQPPLGLLSGGHAPDALRCVCVCVRGAWRHGGMMVNQISRPVQSSRVVKPGRLWPSSLTAAYPRRRAARPPPTAPAPAPGACSLPPPSFLGSPVFACGSVRWSTHQSRSNLRLLLLVVGSVGSR